MLRVVCSDLSVVILQVYLANPLLAVAVVFNKILSYYILSNSTGMLKITWHLFAVLSIMTSYLGLFLMLCMKH